MKKKYFTWTFLILLLAFGCNSDDEDTATDDNIDNVDDGDTTDPGGDGIAVQVKFSQASSFDGEGEGGNLPSLILTGSVEEESSITVTLDSLSTATANGVDFNFESPLVISIAEGTYDGTGDGVIPISGLSIVDDEDEESIESFKLKLTDPTGDATFGSILSTSYSIIDDDAAMVALQFSQTSGLDSEGTGGNLPMLILEGAVERESSITLTLGEEGTATADGVDFSFASPLVVTIPEGNYDGTMDTAIGIPDLSIVDDREEESLEFFELIMSDPTGDVAPGEQLSTTYSIIDDDGPLNVTLYFSQESASGREGAANNLPSIKVMGTLEEPISVTISETGNGTATFGQDFTFQAPGEVVIPAGEYDGTEQTAIAIPGLEVIDDDVLEVSESFELRLSTEANVDYGPVTTTYQIEEEVTPCENGSAGGFPCKGYDLWARIRLSTFSSSRGNDIWGWTDPSTGKEYALVGLTDGTAFVDISGDGQPVYLGKLRTATSSSNWRDVKVYGNYAFIVAEASGHGMQVFDLTRLRNVANPPQIFTADARYTGIGNAHNVVINESMGFAYPVGTSRRDRYRGGVHFVDISNPTSPRGVGGFGGEGYSHDAQVITYTGPDSDYAGREIYIGSNENRIAVVDITDKSNPRGISSLSYPQLAYAHQGWFTEDQRYFLLGDEVDEMDFGFKTRTLVFDMQDLDNPKLHMTYFGPTSAIDHNGYVKGDEYFLSNYRAGVRVLDISSIANKSISESGYFDTFPANDNTGFGGGVWSIYPYFESGKIVVNDVVNGFFVIKKSE